MLLWFAGGAVLMTWVVFRDPAIDYRLIIAGALLPDFVDAWFGGAAVMHSVLASVAVLTAVMVGTTGRRSLRRRLIALPIGMFLHLLLDGVFTDTGIFWWPLSGDDLAAEPLPSVARGWWNLPLELIGAAILVWAWRRFGLADPDRRRTFLRDGRLDRALA